jgi:hypothetical protein
MAFSLPNDLLVRPEDPLFNPARLVASVRV